MAKIDRLVNVQIELGTTAIQGKSFSDMLILAKHSLATGRVMVVTDANQLLELGLLPSDPLYLATSAAFAQGSHVSQVFIGRVKANHYSLDLSEMKRGGKFKAKVQVLSNGNYQSHNVDVNFTTSASETANAVKSNLEGLNAQMTISASDSTLNIELNANVDVVFSEIEGGTLTATYTENLTNALAECAKENNRWYGLGLASRQAAEVLQVADWAEANGKLFLTASADRNILVPSSNTDLASACKEKNYFRTAVMYSHKAETEYPDMALMSYCFTFYPGAENWNLKKLSGVSHSPLSEGEFIAAKNKNCTTFENFNDSFSVTQGGKVAGGEWIDIIRFRDWLLQEIQINTTSAMINAYGKLPYTDAGIEVIGQAIRQALDLGVARGGIAPVELDESGKEVKNYVITLPKAASVSDNNKALRILQDVKFVARLAGAINVTEIKGNLAYSL
ncbi:DUF3383 family protein [[Haemophilus] felis]|nr:DUF3383 family protein [[Haemophilus] felis]